MEVLIPIAGIVMVTILGSIPLIGLTIRFAIKPSAGAIVEALEESRGRNWGSPDSQARLEQVESQLALMQAALDHLADTSAFDRQLSPRAKPSSRD